MTEKLHKTPGIVLRTVKYGETSVIVTVFTELFGVQSYLVNGVRTASRKSGNKASLFQPPAILDLVVYHNELKQLNRIREFRWGYLYERVLSDVTRNAAALFMVELLTRCLRQPESNPDLFHFVEDCLRHLDRCDDPVMANLPLFFALHLPFHFGFRITDNLSDTHNRLDWQEGVFTAQVPGHPFVAEPEQAYFVSQLLKVMQPDELADIRAGRLFRRQLLSQVETFYALHLPEFGRLKTLPLLAEILD